MLVITGGFVYWFGCSLPLFYSIIFFLFSLFVCLYVYVSLCDIVCLVWLLSFLLGFSLFVFFVVLFFPFLLVSMCMFHSVIFSV